MKNKIITNTERIGRAHRGLKKSAAYKSKSNYRIVHSSTAEREKGLVQVSDDNALEGWIAEAITANPKVVEDFKSGKETAAMFLVGQVMKKSQGKANPGMVQDLVRKKLKTG